MKAPLNNMLHYRFMPDCSEIAHRSRRMKKTKKIIHIDMDAFFASVEERDRPELKGKALIVGGDPQSRGVVAACSYEARKYGIHSAMPCSRAYKLCPDAVFLRPRFDAYKEVSNEIRNIFFEYTDLVEPLSLDEAYLDVTVNKKAITSATEIAGEIKKKIVEKTGGLTASAGVSFNKFLAKVASDYRKPDGLTVITPEKAPAFIDNLPVGRIFGVGKVTEKKMHHMGIKTGAHLKKLDKEKLISLFGKSGGYFYKIVHGNDDRPVVTHWVRKSVGKETTLKEDIIDVNVMGDVLKVLAEKIEKYLKPRERTARTITLKVKYFDFKQVTRSITVNEAITGAGPMMDLIMPLLASTEAGEKKVRLLGMSISNFTDDGRDSPETGQLAFPFY